MSYNSKIRAFIFTSLGLITLVCSIKQVGAANPSQNIKTCGENELRSRYQHARPLWAYEGLEKLPKIWAKQAVDETQRQRLMAITVGSVEYWQEMKLRYGLFPRPANEIGKFSINAALAEKEVIVPLGMNATQADALKPGKIIPTRVEGTQVNCRFCHSSVLFTDHKNTSALAEGIPNPFLDFERFHQDISAAGGTPPGFLFRRNPPRNVINAADYFGRLVSYLRPEYPKPSLLRYNAVFQKSRITSLTKQLEEEIPLIPYIKTQAWTNLKYKYAAKDIFGEIVEPNNPSPITVPGDGLYVDGSFFGNVADVTYAMSFTLDSETGQDYLDAREDFKRCVPDYFKTLQAPRYPFLDGLDENKVAKGFKVYSANCSECHGSYEQVGKKEFTLKFYPSRIIPQHEIGTDPLRVTYMFEQADIDKQKFLEGTIIHTHGYKAPPLEGIWARAPYLHNGSVPNIYQVLNSKARMQRFATYPDATDAQNYDLENVGWKVQDWTLMSREEVADAMATNPYIRVFDPQYLSDGQIAKLSSALESLKMRRPEVDPSEPLKWNGLTNTGHTFGDHLSDEERKAVLAFLKTL